MAVFETLGIYLPILYRAENKNFFEKIAVTDGTAVLPKALIL